MERSQIIILSISAICLIFALNRIFSTDSHEYDNYIASVAANSPDLRKQKSAAKELTKSVIRVNPEVRVAIGYALANVIVVHGPKGCAIVDTTESAEAALAARNALEEDMGGPCNVTDIVYTHNHADHVNGAGVFLKWVPKSTKVKIWAHRELPRIVEHSNVLTASVSYIRAMRQFGALLPESHSSGIGMRLKFNNKYTTAYVPPTHFLKGESLDINLAGLSARLIHIPGETDDQIGVYLPSSRSLMCADDVYKAFPNLYAIRGTTFRSHVAWLKSLEKMSALNSEYLVPSHTVPIIGAKEIAYVLQVYRDAVQFVHDQTVRYINRDMGPEEIVHRIGSQLAPSLRDHPYLQPLYGTIAWSVRGLYSGYMGWFSGRTEDLETQLPQERARKLIILGGGPDKVLTEAQEALDQKDFQWALELATAVKRLDTALSKSNLARATDLRIKAMIQLAHLQTSVNGFNYFMTSAYEDMGRVEVKPNKKLIQKTIGRMKIEKLFFILSLRFQGDICNDQNKIVHFRFQDTKKLIEMVIRNGIVILPPKATSETADVEVETTETVWREIIAGERNAAIAVTIYGDVKVKPRVTALKDVMDCFDRQ